MLKQRFVSHFSIVGIFLTLTLCGNQFNSSNENERIQHRFKVKLVHLDNYTLPQFFDTIKRYKIVHAVGSIKKNSITNYDLAYLDSMSNSSTSEHCACIVNPLSSFVPNDYSETSAIAKLMLDSLKTSGEVKFGSWCCAKDE